MLRIRLTFTYIYFYPGIVFVLDYGQLGVSPFVVVGYDASQFNMCIMLYGLGLRRYVADVQDKQML